MCPPLCAIIATPRSAYDPETGRPWTDKHNPDPAQRGRPLVGVPVLYGLVPDGPDRWSGRLYNAGPIRILSVRSSTDRGFA